MTGLNRTFFWRALMSQQLGLTLCGTELQEEQWYVHPAPGHFLCALKLLCNLRQDTEHLWMVLGTKVHMSRRRCEASLPVQSPPLQILLSHLLILVLVLRE